MKMLITPEWLKEKIELESDECCEAGLMDLQIEGYVQISEIEKFIKENRCDIKDDEGIWHPVIHLKDIDNYLIKPSKGYNLSKEEDEAIHQATLKSTKLIKPRNNNDT